MEKRRDILTTPASRQLARAKRKKRQLWLVLFLFLFIIIIIGLSYLSNYKKFVIVEVQVEGTHIIDPLLVKELVQKDLSGRYLKLFTKSNVLIYPKGKIEKDISNRFPRTESIAIRRVGFRTIVISITERSGSYLYCGENVPADTTKLGDNCYFVNNDGLIFDEAPYFSGDVYFKFYVKVGDGVASPLQQKVLPDEKFKKIIGFIDGLEALGLHAVGVVMSDPILYEFNLARNTNNTMPKVLFSSESDLDTIMANLTTAMSKKEFKDQIFDKYNSLLYIDLRFKNKVLYKFNE